MRITGCVMIFVIAGILLMQGISASSKLQCVQVPDDYDLNTTWQTWSVLPSIETVPGGGLNPRNNDDLSANVILAWNSNYIFVITRVIDDIFSPSDNISAFWNGDSIQFGFTPADDISNSDGILLGAADLPSGQKVINTVAPADYPQGIWDVPFRVLHDGSTHTYFIALPWKYAGILNPLRDTSFRFNLIINENDGARRLGWLEISDGIGHGYDPDKFLNAEFVYTSTDPCLHLSLNKMITDKSGVIKLTASTRNVAAGSKLSVDVGGKITESIIDKSDNVTISISAKEFSPGEVPISAKLFDAADKLISSKVTSVLVTDPTGLYNIITHARDALREIDDTIKKAHDTGMEFENIQLRANCLRYALRVASLAETGYIAPDGIKHTEPKIYESAVRYLETTAPRLLDDAKRITEKSAGPESFITPLNLLQPWKVKDGDIYAGNNPIALNGFIWQYCIKDMSYKLSDLGLGMQSIDIGSNHIITEPYKLADDLLNVDFVKTMRYFGLKGQEWGETFDLHTSPHYIPKWFEEWAKKSGVLEANAWMGTDEGKRLLDLMYKGHMQAFGDIKAIKTADLANEWFYWSVKPESIAEFRNWLQKKHGSIQKLNYIWGTKYQSYNNIPFPYPSDTTSAQANSLTPEGVYRNRAPFWDWCCFNSEKSSSIVKWMNDTFKKNYPGPLTHIKCILSSREYRTLAGNFILGIDPQRILPITDLIGTDASYSRGGQWKGTLFAYDYMKSICPGKPIFCSEMHAVPYDDPDAPSEIRRGLFQRFIHGERLNLLFLNTTLSEPLWWDRNGETSIFNIGAAPDALESFALTSFDLQRLSGYLGTFNTRPSEVLIFYDNAADFDVPGYGTPGTYADRALKVYESLLYHDLKTGFITEDMLLKKTPSASLIILTVAQYVTDATVKALKKYIDKGGKILWLGDNLQFDQYGRSRKLGDIKTFDSSKNIYRDKVYASAGEYNQILDRLIADGILNPAFSYTSDSKNIEILSAGQLDGSSLIFLANTLNSPVKLSLTGEGMKSSSGIDLISGRSVNLRNLNISGNGVMIIKVR